jgi:lipoprotein-releasing system permease protein
MVRGVDPLLEPSVSDLGVKEQKVQDSVLKLLKPGEFSIVLGYALANQLGVQLNDKVTLMLPGGQLTPAGTLPRMKQLTVVGVFDSGHYEFDSSLAMIHLEDAQKLYRVDGPTGIRVKLHNLHIARDFAPVLEASLSDGLVARDWTRQNKSWFAAVQVEKRMMSIILTLIVAVAAFNLVSTLVMTVTDKTSDIAILRTLGASPKSIMAIFVVQGAVIGVVGTAIGLLLGLLIAFNVGTIVSIIEALFQVSFLPRDIYLLSRMPSDPQFADIFPVVLISLVLAFIATIYPSWRASRLNPAHALRYD